MRSEKKRAKDQEVLAQMYLERITLEKQIRELRVQAARATAAQSKLNAAYVSKLLSALDKLVSSPSRDNEELDDILNLLEVQFEKKK
jgi:hypothetical protein